MSCLFPLSNTSLDPLTDVEFVGCKEDLAPLYNHEVVMAMESQPDLDPKLPPSGLCNAVILARPYSPFIRKFRYSI